MLLNRCKIYRLVPIHKKKKKILLVHRPAASSLEDMLAALSKPLQIYKLKINTSQSMKLYDKENDITDLQPQSKNLYGRKITILRMNQKLDHKSIEIELNNRTLTQKIQIFDESSQIDFKNIV